MRKKMFLILIAVLALALAASVGAECEKAGGIEIFVEGESINAGAVLAGDTTMVPIRKISEALGFDVLWDGGEESVTISKGSANCKMYIGSTAAQKSGEWVTLSKAPEIIGSVTYVPVRYISESLDYAVFWDELTKSVYIAKCIKADAIDKFGPYSECVTAFDGSKYYFYDSGETGYAAVKDGFVTEIFSADESLLNNAESSKTTVSDEIYYYNAFGADSKPYKGGTDKEDVLALQEKQVFYAVNAVRRANNLSNLELNERISDADRRHVISMAKEGYFSHTGSDGSTFKQRYENTFGVPEFTLAAENLAKVSNAGEALQLWMKSESHRNAILTEKFKLTGVCAYCENESEFIYFAQIFVKPKE